MARLDPLGEDGHRRATTPTTDHPTDTSTTEIPMSDTETTRPAPPPLEFPPPPCSICGKDTEVVDAFECPDCGASWPLKSAHLADGSWDEPQAACCPAEFHGHRCYRSAGHDQEWHANPRIGMWTSTSTSPINAAAPRTSGSAA